MTSLDPLSTPVVQLSDLATADLQLVLDGVPLPWPVLGGRAGEQPSGGPVADQEVQQEVQLEVPAGTAAEAVAAGRLVLGDREQTPVAELVDVVEVVGDASGPAATGAPVHVAGLVRPLRARESRLFLDHAQPPAKLGPPVGSRHVVVVGRPLLDEDVVALSALDGPVLLLVPVEAPTSDGVPPVTLMRSVLHSVEAAGGWGGRVRVVAVPVHWRDSASDQVLADAVGAAYGADRTELVRGGADWADLLRRLRSGDELPQVAAPSVLRELRRWRRRPAERGAMVLFTGLSGSGKSTLARDLAAHVLERTPRTVSLLDGDDVRRLLSSGLGFDHAARDLNVRRIGFVGSEIARHGGLAVCAPIAPYAESRAAVRAMVEPVGDFVLVHVSTSLEECERRDLKGLYARARAGLITEFTGISDPYDVPTDADLVVDTAAMSREEALNRVLDLLHERGLIIEDAEDEDTP